MDKKQPKGFSQPPTTQDLYRLEVQELKQEIKRLRVIIDTQIKVERGLRQTLAESEANND